MLKIIEQTALGHFKYLPEKLGFAPTNYQNLSIINCGLGSSMFNIVFGSVNSDVLKDDLQNVINQFKGQPFAWWINPSEYSSSLSALLKESGFKIETKEYAMILDLELLENKPDITELKIKQVIEQRDLQDFISILEPYDKTSRSFYEKFPISALDLQEKLFVGYHNNDPVIIAILFEGEEATGIFSVLTSENERKKGFGTSMMQYLLNLSKKNGKKYTTLSASSDSGYRIYEKLGFKSIGEFECFEYNQNTEV